MEKVIITVIAEGEKPRRRSAVELKVKRVQGDSVGGTYSTVDQGNKRKKGEGESGGFPF